MSYVASGLPPSQNVRSPQTNNNDELALLKWGSEEYRVDRCESQSRARPLSYEYASDAGSLGIALQ